jgi:proteasome lid subunit RPN8/RPN11
METKIPSKLKQKTINAILKHAESGYPEEVCGVVVITPSGAEKYIKCKNIATDKTKDFKMCPESFAEAEDIGDVVGICHSHPDATSKPSSHDLAVMSTNREFELLVDPDSQPIPWHIVSWPDGDYRQVIPEVRSNILGRPFVHGFWDCWQACNDYYNKYHGITFERFKREDGWWEIKDGPSLYEEFFKGAGFYEVDTPEPGDMIVMQIGRSYHPNHAAIYLGNISKFEDTDLYGGPFMLHHLYGHNSEIAIYGGNWFHRTRLVLRHKEI